MRNLKKILALVLALVMSMSLVTIANASDFTDADDITYEEAADVMSTIGVIEGFEDGSFDPDGTLTREQAAKLVTYMLLGADADNLGIERSSFNDVAMTRWSAPAIEYCVSLGIIDGAGDGNFYPAGQLTAVAFAKVLLTALGYDSDAEGLVGTSWSVNTSALATEVGLDNGIEDLVWSAAITREEAAQMALNTIKAPLVAYDGGVTVVVGDTPVSFGSGDAYYVTTTLAREQRISDEQLSNSDDYTVEFGERYFPRLRLIRETDEYERPSYTWVYENTELGTYVNYDLLVETYTEGVDGRTLFELLGRSTIQRYGLTYYVDGAETDLDKDLLVRSNTSDVGATGNGVLTQVFVDHDNEEIIITSINTYLAVAISDYSENNEYATLRVYTGVDSANQVQTRTYNVDVADVPNVADVTMDTFYAVNLSYKDDATYAEVAKIDDVEIMEDCSITGYSSNNGNSTIRDAKVTELTTGGEDYDANAKAFYDDEVLYRYDENLLTDNTYTIYLDQYGYFLGVELFEGSQNYVFITGFDRNSSNLSVKTATATGIFLDGQMENIQVNVTNTDKNIERAWNNHEAGKDNAMTYVKWSNTAYNAPGDWDDLGKSGQDGIYDLNQWFTYTVNEDNVYTLKPAVRNTWTGYTSADGNADGDVIIRTDNLSVENDFPRTVIGGAYGEAAGYVYGNDDTIFLTVDLDVVDTTGGSRRAITEVNGVYTGVQNVDIIVDTDDPNAVDKGQVFTVYDSNGYAIAAVVIGEAQGATGNYAYILSEAKSERLNDGTYEWTFDAILDGEKQTLTARGDYNSTIALIDRGDVVELRFDGDYVVDVRTIDNDNIYGNRAAYSNKNDLTENLNGQDIYSMLDLSANSYVASLQLNTLYITENRSDRGLAIASGAKAVVIQSENNKEVITNCSSVSEAVSRLGDPNTSTTIKEYAGDIVAVLNSNGAAEWVVFVSDTPVGTGSQGSTVTDGNITLTAQVWDTGFAAANYTVTRPNYIDNTVALNYNVTVYVNGQPYDTFSGEIGAGQPSNTGTWDNSGFGWMTRPLAVGDRITATVSFPQSGSIDNHDMEDQNFILKVVDQHGNDLKEVLDKPSSNSYVVAATGSGTNRTFDFDDTLYQGGTFQVTGIEGGTASVTLPATTDWDDSIAFNIKADGDNFVTVTINTSAMQDAAVTYSVTASEAFDASDAADAVVYSGHAVGTAPAIKDLGLGSALDGETGTLKVDFVDNTGASKVGSITPGYSVKVKVTTGTLVAAAADVTVIVNGVRYKDGDWITANSDLVVQGLEVNLTSKLAIESAEMSTDGLTMTVKFNQRVSMKTGVLPTVANIISGGVPTTTNSIVSVDLSGDELVVKFSRAMADGDKLQVSNTNIIGSNVADNVVTGNRVIRVNVDGDGNYTCGVNAS